MNVDREQQKQMLEFLFAEYPSISEKSFRYFRKIFEAEPERTSGNLLYLQRHGLIGNAISIRPGLSFSEHEKQKKAIYAALGEDESQTLGPSIENGDGSITIGPATLYHPQITEKGIDFLLGDEGLSAILNTHTVRIEDTSLRQLAIIIAQSANASQKEKETVISILKSAPLSALKKWLTEVAGEALPSPEAAIRLLQIVLNAAQSIL